MSGSLRSLGLGIWSKWWGDQFCRGVTIACSSVPHTNIVGGHSAVFMAIPHTILLVVTVQSLWPSPIQYCWLSQCSLYGHPPYNIVGCHSAVFMATPHTILLVVTVQSLWPPPIQYCWLSLWPSPVQYCWLSQCSLYGHPSYNIVGCHSAVFMARSVPQSGVRPDNQLASFPGLPLTLWTLYPKN